MIISDICLVPRFNYEYLKFVPIGYTGMYFDNIEEDINELFTIGSCRRVLLNSGIRITYSSVKNNGCTLESNETYTIVKIENL